MDVNKFSSLTSRNFYKFPKGFEKSPFWKIKNRILIVPDKKDELYELLKKRTIINRSLVFDLDTLSLDILSMDTWNMTVAPAKSTGLIVPMLLARILGFLGQMFFRTKGYNYCVFVSTAKNISDVKGLFTNIAIIGDHTDQFVGKFTQNLCDDIVTTDSFKLTALLDWFTEIVTLAPEDVNFFDQGKNEEEEE